MLAFASLITFSILFGFIAVVISLAMYYGGQIDLTMMIGFTVVINVILWLIAPFFMEIMYRLFYKSKKMTMEELHLKSDNLAKFIESICQKHSFRIPSLLILDDDNPTAFVFGSAAFNARLVFSSGLFTYLNEDEIMAVIAHELGHIKRRDFIVMTVASTLVQILYEFSQVLIRSKSKNSKNNPLPAIGFLAYIFYIAGSYLLLFLSRTREYGADMFSALETGNPDSLSRALIKIAYGIIAKPEDIKGKRLLESTRALGILDHRSAKNIGSVYESNLADGSQGKQNWNFAAKVLFYDLVSPWAKVLELASTHPLTGKRIDKLSEMARRKGQTPSIDMQAVKNTPYDQAKLYQGFTLGIIIYFLPWILILIILISSLFYPLALFFIPGAVGLSLLIKLWYKYPNGQPEKMTTLDAMSDLYASPVKGRLIELEGQAIGKGIAGSRFNEDMMFQDKVGLIYLNYESAIPIFGNLFFGWKKVRELLNLPAKAEGWFLRGVSHHLDLKIFMTQNKTIRSHPRLWISIFAGILLLISVFTIVAFIIGGVNADFSNLS